MAVRWKTKTSRWWTRPVWPGKPVTACAVSEPLAAGRFCPPDYRISPDTYNALEPHSADVLYVAGGLYGNTEALAEIERLYALDVSAVGADRCDLVFNGDFHWFDASIEAFAEIHQRTSAFYRLRGNVETELARENDSAAGCGCAYPDSVSDQDVAWSNQIIALLATVGRQAIGADAMQAMSKLPVTAKWQVADCAVAITHGDHESLAGWSFAQDRLAQTWADGLADQMQAWNIDIFACSHTCLPVAQSYEQASRAYAVVNNGAAGLANARGMAGGIVTRIARSGVAKPPVEPLYSARIGSCEVSALPVNQDETSWQQKFLSIWPEHSAAHSAYFARIVHGPDYSLDEAARGRFSLSPNTYRTGNE